MPPLRRFFPHNGPCLSLSMSRKIDSLWLGDTPGDATAQVASDRSLSPRRPFHRTSPSFPRTCGEEKSLFPGLRTVFIALPPLPDRGEDRFASPSPLSSPCVVEFLDFQFGQAARDRASQFLAAIFFCNTFLVEGLTPTVEGVGIL